MHIIFELLWLSSVGDSKACLECKEVDAWSGTAPLSVVCFITKACSKPYNGQARLTTWHSCSSHDNQQNAPMSVQRYSSDWDTEACLFRSCSMTSRPVSKAMSSGGFSMALSEGRAEGPVGDAPAADVLPAATPSAPGPEPESEIKSISGITDRLAFAICYHGSVLQVKGGKVYSLA